MRIALVGNCQVKSYRTLLEAALPGANVMSLDLSTAEGRDAVQRETFAERCTDRDLIIAQAGRAPHVSGAALRERYGPDRVAVIANLYFRGLFLDQCHIGPPGRRLPLPYHSVVALLGHRLGLSPEDTAALFTCETYAALGLFEGWRTSLLELHRRDLGVDVPATPLIKAAVREAPAFHTVNHPTIALAAAYLRAVLGGRGLHLDLPPVDDPLAFFAWPLFDFVAERFDLPYRATRQVVTRTRTMDLVEYIAISHRIFSAADPADCVIHSPRDLIAALSTSTDNRAALLLPGR